MMGIIIIVTDKINAESGRKQIQKRTGKSQKEYSYNEEHHEQDSRIAVPIAR